MKKVISILLAAVMVVSIFAGLQISSSALEPSGSCGYNATYTFDSSTGLLTISGTGKISNYFFQENNDIKSVVIEEGITSVGWDLFNGCSALTSITIPDSVISIGGRVIYDTAYYANPDNWDNNLLYIGNHLIKAKETISGAYTVKSGTRTIADLAFGNCTGLTSITIPDSTIRIGIYAFEYCSSLTSITIPDSVTSIGFDAFLGTSYYKDNDNWVNGVLYIDNHLIFAKENISGNYIIKDGTKSIASNAFDECEDLTSVTIPNSVTGIGRAAFADCSGLTSITIPDSVTIIEDMAFQCCNGLTSITIPNSVKIIGEYAFNWCSELTSVTIGNSVINIDEGAFSGCEKLTKVNITDLSSWCRISFANSNANPVYYSENLYLNDALLTDLVLPISITKVGNYAFYNCKSIESVSIPNSVTSIGECAFEYCNGIKEVYYDGMPINWKAIDIKEYNYNLEDATIHYNIPEHEHTFDSGVVTKDATCSEKGIKTFTCTYCGTEKTEDIPKNPDNHSFYGGICSGCGAKDPNFILPVITETCTKTVSVDSGKKYYASFTPIQNGTITFYSTGSKDTLGYLYNSEMSLLRNDDDSGEGSNFSFTYDVEAGKEYIVACGLYSGSGDLTFIFEYELAHVHDYTDVVTAPTCTEQGYTTHTCACGDSYKDTYVDARGHDFSDNAEFCRNGCGTANPDYVAPHVHSYTDVVTPPTCTAKGFTTHTCACGDSYKDTYVNALGHKWDAGKVTKKATPTATGIKTYTCKVCKAKKTSTIAKCAKYANTLTVKGKKVNASFAKLKKANLSIAKNSVLTISKAQGKLTYAKTSGNKSISINKTKGTIQIKKGIKKGTYKIGVKVTAAGNATYKSASKTATITVVVK